MAQLKAKLATDVNERRHWKTHLVRLMYQRHYQKPEILQLFRLIDWMIRLPRELEREFLEDHYAFEEARKMTYVTSAERFGIEKGREEGIEKGREEGIEKGREETRMEMARNLIQRLQLDDATIAELTGLSKEEVHKLRPKH